MPDSAGGLAGERLSTQVGDGPDRLDAENLRTVLCRGGEGQEQGWNDRLSQDHRTRLSDWKVLPALTRAAVLSGSAWFEVCVPGAAEVKNDV